MSCERISGMPVHQLTEIGTSGGVVLPKSELRRLGLVDDQGGIRSVPVVVRSTGKETWELEVLTR